MGLNKNSIRSFVTLIVGVQIVSVWSEAEGKSCPGYCTNDIGGCKLHGGKVLAYCKNGQACCNKLVPEGITSSCGEKRNATSRVSFFKSPKYPLYSAGDLTCEFKLDLASTSSAFKLDFIDVEMDGLRFGRSTAQCDSDMIFIKGFKNWSPPPRCGYLSGYSTIIDRSDSRASKIKTLSIIAVMSGPKYKWLIRVTQYGKDLSKFEEFNEDPKDKSSTEKPPPFDSDSNGPIPSPKDRKTEHENSDTTDSTPGFQSLDTNSEVISHNQKMRNNSKLRTTLVVNGKDTKIAAVPWQISLRVLANPPPEVENCTEGEGYHFCGGSIIDSKHILSAAHCFFGSTKLTTMQQISNVKVVVGDTNRCENGAGDPQSTDHAIESVTYHYDYDEAMYANDVVVIRLRDPIKLGPTAKPVELASKGMSFVGKEVLLSGWGLTNVSDVAAGAGKPPRVLQSTRSLIVDNRNACLELYESGLDVPNSIMEKFPKYSHNFESVICTKRKPGAPITVSGQGDSGGPLVFDKRHEPLQIGIVSYGFPTPHLKEAMADFYQSVSFFRNWIDLAVSMSSHA